MKLDPKYYDLQINGSAWTTKFPFYQGLLSQGMDWLIENLDPEFNDILDLGCGDGWGTEYLISKLPYGDVVGGDIDKNKLKVAKDRGIPVKEIDMHDVKGKWDAIFCSHSLEHSYDISKALNSILDALNTNGKLYLIVPIEPEDPRALNPSHTQWINSESVINKIITARKDVQIEFFESKVRDGREYWLIVKKL